jgi:hypothetical protein
MLFCSGWLPSGRISGAASMYRRPGRISIQSPLTLVLVVKKAHVVSGGSSVGVSSGKFSALTAMSGLGVPSSVTRQPRMIVGPS